jgi:hypothetical protein
MKRLLLVVAFVSLVAAISCFQLWGHVVGSTNEDWDPWSAKITLLWRIIPAAFGISILSGVTSMFLKPRSRTGLVLAGCLVLAAVAALSGIAFIMMHLRIG